jgi:hypothetical protein
MYSDKNNRYFIYEKKTKPIIKNKLLFIAKKLAITYREKLNYNNETKI